jgi:hypothetical protein
VSQESKEKESAHARQCQSEGQGKLRFPRRHPARSVSNFHAALGAGVKSVKERTIRRRERDEVLQIQQRTLE